jgi:hypothetical protein
MASISRSTAGTTFPYIKCLYTAVIKLCTRYAAIIWYRPWDKTSPMQKQITALTTVRRHAIKAMLSTFRTAPTDLVIEPIAFRPKGKLSPYIDENTMYG